MIGLHNNWEYSQYKLEILLLTSETPQKNSELKIFICCANTIKNIAKYKGEKEEEEEEEEKEETHIHTNTKRGSTAYNH